MDVTATIYLKSGANVSLDIHNTSLEEQQKIYSSSFDPERDVRLINHVGPKSIEMIPVDNVALIQIKELVKPVRGIRA